MEKKIYTFEEILIALRKEFLEHQKYLQELKKYIYIEDNRIKDFYFDSSRGLMRNDKIVRNKQLHLIIEERLNILKKLREKLLYLGSDYEKSNLLNYNVITDSKRCYGFELDTKGLLVDINPIINITNQKEFDELVNEILNTDYMNLIDKRLKMTTMTDSLKFRIWGRQIYLHTLGKTILYDPKYDALKFSGFDYIGDIITLFMSFVSEFQITDGLQVMIDKNFQEGKVIEFDGYMSSKELNEFNIKDDDRGLTLVKTK